MDIEWPYEDPRNLAVITLRGIRSKKEPIMNVFHDSEGWQFLGGGPSLVKDIMVVSLESIVNLDPSVLQLADLPVGWQASRTHQTGDWKRAPTEPDEDSE